MSFYPNNLAILDMTLDRILPLLNKHAQQTAYTQKTTPKNTLIYHPHQNQDKIYLLKSGRIKIGVKNTEGIELIHQIAWSGDVFAENTLFQKQASNQFAQTLEESTYYEINAQALCSFWQENRWLQWYFLELFAERLQKAERKLYDFVRKDTSVRIIEFLMEIAQEKGLQNGFSYELSPFFTQAQIGGIIGCSSQMAGLVLRDLKKKSLVTYSKKELIIRELDKLKFYHTLCAKKKSNIQKLHATPRVKLKRKTA